MSAALSTPSLFGYGRASRRTATRREVVVPCQAVRERDFVLVAERTLDVSPDGLLLPTRGVAVQAGDALIVSFAIPGTWIDAEATVTRVIRGRRPSDEGPAIGIMFDVISPASRAALAGFLHGRPPPLPRRGPLARLRRGQEAPRLADHGLMSARSMLEPPPALAFASEDDVSLLEDEGAGVDGLDVLRAVASAWRALGAGAE